ncbi:MAG: DMT family transporter, partial [Planctomycetaceae bacterium]
VWAFWGIAAKLPTGGISPIAIQAISCIGMLPLALGLLLAPRLKNRPGNLWRGLVFAILVGIASPLGNILMFYAFSAGGRASIVVSLTGMYPLLTVFLAQYIFNEQLSRYQKIGIALSLVAVLLFNLSGKADSSSAPIASSRFLSAWMAFSIAALLMWGVAGILQKAATKHVSIEMTTLCATLATFVLSGLFLLVEPAHLTNVSAKQFLYATTFGLLTALGFWSATAAYRWGKASVVTALMSLYPALTTLLAVPILGERLTATILAAVVLSKIAGVAMSIETRESEG